MWVSDVQVVREVTGYTGSCLMYFVSACAYISFRN